MKQYASFMIIIMVLLSGVKCILVTGSREVHREELGYALRNAELHSLRNACVTHDYPVESDEELYADFLSELTGSLSQVPAMEVRIYELSLMDGIMDIEVILTYDTVRGTESVAARKRMHVVYADEGIT